MHYLEIKHLRMLRAIAATGNLTRAAENLCLSQSALSQQLKDIENKLQVALFFRTKKKMVLTSAGQYLLRKAEHLLEVLEEAELEIARIVSGEKGELKVGTQCIFCYKWLPAVMESFQNKFPDIDFELGNSEDLTADLESRKYDLIISVRPDKREDLAAIPLFEDQVVCIMPPDHPLRHRSFVRYEDFNGESFISFTEKSKTRFYQVYLQPQGIEPRRFMSVTQPQAIMEMVAAGIGISIFPRWAVNGSHADGSVLTRPITQNGFRLKWYAVYMQGANNSVFLNEFIKLLSRTHNRSGMFPVGGYVPLPQQA